MSVIKNKDGKWKVDVQRAGIPRTRKSFTVKSDAELFERQYLASHQISHRLSSDQRTLKELVDLWFKYHGINLSDGLRCRDCLDKMSSELGNPQASIFTPEKFVDYRYSKIKGGLNEKTFNNHHGYLSAMYNKLIKLKVIEYENPIKEVDFIKLQERQLSYLSVDQLFKLLEVIKNGCENKSTWYVSSICIRTGARWGEVENLRMKQLHNNRITYEFTKGKRTRTIPIEKSFFDQLISFAGYKNPEDRVFSNCIGSFRRAIKRSKIQLPKGQNTHILRHSFASHFMMNDGNILTLQKILGHADITMTMRYAHLSPDHLADAVKLNPIA